MRRHGILWCNLAASMLLFGFATAEKDQCTDSDKKMKVVKKYLSEARDSLLVMRGTLKYMGCNLDANKGPSQVKSEASTKEIVTTEEITTTTKIVYPEVCANFAPVQEIDKTVACFLGKMDLDKGIRLEKIIASKLCTDVYLMVPVNYTVQNPYPGYITPIDSHFDDKFLEKWSKLGVKLMMQIGTWSDPSRMTPQKFTKALSMSGSRAKFITAISDFLTTSLVKYHGILISWYYPGCPMDDCQVGPASDEHRYTDFLKELRKSFAASSFKIALEVSLLPDNVYMGYDIQTMKKLVDIMLLEISSGEFRISWNSRVRPSTANEYEKALSTPFKYAELVKNVLKKMNRTRADLNSSLLTLLELETVVAYVNLRPQSKILVFNQTRNITVKEACLLTKEKGVVLNNNTKYDWPHAYKDNDLYIYPEINSLKKKIDAIVYKQKISGVWIRDLWADDIENECGCGSYPILKTANEALGRSKCIMPNCPT